MPEDSNKPCLPYEWEQLRCGQGDIQDSIGGRNDGRGGRGGEEGRREIRGGGMVATAMLCSLTSWSRRRGGAGASVAKLPSPILAAALALALSSAVAPAVGAADRHPHH